MIQFDEHVFSEGLVQPPTRFDLEYIPGPSSLGAKFFRETVCQLITIP